MYHHNTETTDGHKSYPYLVEAVKIGGAAIGGIALGSVLGNYHSPTGLVLGAIAGGIVCAGIAVADLLRNRSH
jgi:hypothetical protein